jgi:uncharacterized protein with HEPN domain
VKPQNIFPKEPERNILAVPWRDMAGMRDRLIHGYFGVNLAVVWKTIKERLPIVKPLVEEALVGMREEAKQKEQPDKV